MSNSDANITKGTTSLPKVGGMLGGNVYFSDCSIINPTVSSAHSKYNAWAGKYVVPDI